MRKTVILENIRSCHNVGAIFRTADAAGFDEVILAGYTPAPPDRRIEKVSLGAETFLDWQQSENQIELVKKLKANGYLIVALEQSDKSTDIFNTKLPTDKNIALILGNEVEGVTAELLALADHHVEIPMYGQKTSLNVSVAAGIAFYAVANN